MIEHLLTTLRGLARLATILAAALALTIQVVDADTALAIARSH